jgi:hypothetical protein
MTDAELLDGLYVVFFGTQVEVVRGPPHDDDHGSRVVIAEWIAARFPMRRPGAYEARLAPPTPDEVSARALTERDVDLFAQWDGTFRARLAKLRKAT